MAEAEPAAAEAAAAEELKIHDYMCHKAMSLDDIGKEFVKWRKRDDKVHEKGDWVMLCQEPLLEGQDEQLWSWVVAPGDHVGKGGPEVAARAAQVLLMSGRLFDVKQDVTKKSEARKATLAREATSYEVAKFKNGKTAREKANPYADTDDEDDVEYHGLPCLFGVRFKGHIITADTMTDSQAVHGRDKMKWANDVLALRQAINKQANFHLTRIDEQVLAQGKAPFLEVVKRHHDKINS